jgi:restriction system protein
MAVWVVKAGRMGEREQRILDHGVIAIGWEEMGNLSHVQTREELKEVYRSTYTTAAEGEVNTNVGQIWAFLRRMANDDLVVVPIKTRSEVAAGTIHSEYKHSDALGSDMRHLRDVQWIRTDIPRAAFDQDLLYSFGAFMTVCQVTRNNAEARIKAIVEGRPTSSPEEEASDEQASLNLEEVAQDQILTYIERNFKGHGLAGLVDGVLRAQGYITRVSPPGADGGVDILAGRGPIGLDSPRVCVQVKSSSGRVDVEIYRALRGTMQALGAEQGLLVGWGGFTQATIREAESSYFAVQLWDRPKLMDALLRLYDSLPTDIQADLPLKKMWRLALPVEEES